MKKLILKDLIGLIDNIQDVAVMGKFQSWACVNMRYAEDCVFNECFACGSYTGDKDETPQDCLHCGLSCDGCKSFKPEWCYSWLYTGRAEDIPVRIAQLQVLKFKLGYWDDIIPIKDRRRKQRAYAVSKNIIAIIVKEQDKDV